MVEQEAVINAALDRNIKMLTGLIRGNPSMTQGNPELNRH